MGGRGDCTQAMGRRCDDGDRESEREIKTRTSLINYSTLKMRLFAVVGYSKQMMQMM